MAVTCMIYGRHITPSRHLLTPVHVYAVTTRVIKLSFQRTVFIESRARFVVGKSGRMARGRSKIIN